MDAGKNTPSSSCSGRFGPSFPGKRCLAKTRSGGACQKPALKGKARCQLHGGRAGAPTGERNGNYKTGRHTKEAVEQRRETRRRLAALYALGKQIGMFN
jgi:hypothetical protein